MSTAPPAPRERAAAAPASSPEPSLPEGALGMRSGPEPQLAERALGRESSGSAPRPISVATANLHAGVDGWGRPFPAVERCLELARGDLVDAGNIAALHLEAATDAELRVEVQLEPDEAEALPAPPRVTG